MSPPKIKRLDIGGTVLEENDARMYWIEFENGEGMEIPQEDLKRILREYYQDNFC